MDADDGQADIVAQIFPLLGSLVDDVRDQHLRDCLLGAMRAARWWHVATSRLHADELALQARGGFLVDVALDEALEVDLLDYYLFGALVLDRVAAYAVSANVDGAWKGWLKALDEQPDNSTRQHARALDIYLRVTRDKLLAHVGIDAKFTWGTGGPGTTNFAAIRVPFREVTQGIWSEAQAVSHTLGIVTGDRTNVADAMALMDGLRSRATLLEERGRNAYRAVAESVGLEAVATVDVTWRVVELVRSFRT